MRTRGKKTELLLSSIAEITKARYSQKHKIINKILKKVCDIYGAGWILLNELTKDTLKIENLYHYPSTKKTNAFVGELDGLGIDSFEWAARKTIEGTPIYFTDTGALPLSASKEKRFLKAHKVDSLIMIPALENNKKRYRSLAILDYDTTVNVYNFEIKLLELLTFSISSYIDKMEVYRRLKKTSKKYGLLAKNAQDIIYRYSLWPDKGFDYVNPAATKITGYTPSEHYRDPELPMKMIHPDDMGILEDIYKDGIDFSRPIRARWRHRDGYIIWTEEKIKPVYDSKGRLIAIEGIARDITERKKIEERIEYLSFHDKLTGLYNRAYFDEEMSRLDTKRSLPLSILIADLNGLKLVNDVFGHLTGDKLLKECAECLKKCCRTDDIIARWGGDEFAIILPNTSRAKAEEILSRIYDYCDREKNQLKIVVPLSISVGVGTKTDEKIKTETVIKRAEDDMYRKKLKDKRESIESTIESMKRSLMKKEIETSGHLSRLKQSSVALGRKLGFKKQMLDDLGLLAEMHDIGKVSVFDDILNKKSSLTDQEWKVIKKHPEVGYRLVSSSNELISIAEYVLGHHERWDGKGYPRGLKGNDIPIFCRILAIADAYDVMTHDTVYREALSEEEAIGELKKQSGKQFDPGLVREFIDMVN